MHPSIFRSLVLYVPCSRYVHPSRYEECSFLQHSNATPVVREGGHQDGIEPGTVPSHN